MYFEDPFLKKGLFTFQDERSNESSGPDFIEFERFTEFEDDANSSRSAFRRSVSETSSRPSNHMGGEVARILDHQQPVNQLMLVSLLEHICSLHVQDEPSSDTLFKVLYDRLRGMMLMPDVSYLDDFKAIRVKYQTAFKDLMSGALKNIQNGGIFSMEVEKSWHLATRSISPITVHSWYTDMFHDEVRIAIGGFGHVVKATNKLDRKEYAIKKILLLDAEPTKCMKTLREVQVFSDLDHQNIVRYHSSWLEYGVEESCPADKPQNSLKQRTSHPEEDKKQCETFKSLVPLTHSFRPCALAGHFGFNAPRYLSGNNVDETNCCPKTPNLLKALRRSISLPHIEEVEEEVSFCRGNNWTKKHPMTTSKDFRMTLFIQMELCDITLRHWLKDRNEKISHTVYVDRVVNHCIIRQALRGVEYLHMQGLLHRDLKPANIFMNYHGKDGPIVKVGDFGLARYDVPSATTIKTPVEEYRKTMSASDLFDYQNVCQKTDIPTIGVGTTTYAAPEQIQRSDYTNKIDIYSLGIIIFELYRPFGSQMERGKLIGYLLRGEMCSEVNEKWRAESSLIKQMISEEPNNRPSAAQILTGPLFRKEMTMEEMRELIDKQQLEIRQLKRRLEQNICMSCHTKAPVDMKTFES